LHLVTLQKESGVGHHFTVISRNSVSQ